MADWPEKLKVGPIREWPGVQSRRRASPFRRNGTPMKLSTTLGDLDTELRAVKAKNPELLVAIDPSKFRRDGRPYANAEARHPGVILSFEISDVGRVSYPCDTFLTWEDNLRAIVLALEALRKVDRYGVGKLGDQYRGYLAIEAVPSGEWASTALAREFIETYISELGVTTVLGDIAFQVKQAKRLSHPDLGGDAETFRKVMSAEKRLREAGELG